MNDADALGHVLAGQTVFTHQLGQALLQGFEFGAQQARFQLFQQMLNGDQCQNVFLTGVLSPNRQN